MTKANLRKMYQERANEVFCDSWNDETLKELQKLNAEYGDGHRWCSWDTCLEGIMKGGSDRAIFLALDAYRRHIAIDTLEREYRNIATKTNNMNI